MKQPCCILLDIEGTTSSISFVHDVMFPFVREHLRSFLAEHWDSAVVQDCLPLLAKDVGENSVAAWLGKDVAPAQSRVIDAVNKLMDDDVKATGLKKLQGAIWKDGFESSQLVAHLYDDVEAAIGEWVKCGIDVRIYSSGSIDAQKLFFGHSVAGNLLPLFNGHYDTTVGPKKESSSYTAIASDIGLPASDILFVSDVIAELAAAATAGMNGLLSVRPGNKPVEVAHDFKTITSFAEIQFEGQASLQN